MDYKALKTYVLERVDIEAEFRTAFPGWKAWDNVSCPMATEKHSKGEDKSKGCQTNESGLVYCHACGYRASSPIDLYADLNKVSFKEALTRYYREYVEEVVPDVIVKALNKQLLANPFLMANLEKQRGLTEATVRRFKLGWNGRLTIPIYNELGICVNLRSYDLLGQFEHKMISYKKGFGKARLWFTSSMEPVKGDKYWLCEGELDAILVSQMGLPAVTSTGGAGKNKWKEDWTKVFKGMSVVVVADMDEVGKKAGKEISWKISKVAKSSTLLELPLSGNKGDKDVTDWVLYKKGTKKQLEELANEPVKKGTKKTSDDTPSDDSEETTLLEHTYSPADKVAIERGNLVINRITSRGGKFFKDAQSQIFLALNSGAAMVMSMRSIKFMSYLARIDPIITPVTTAGKSIIQFVLNTAEDKSETSRSGNWCLNDGARIYVVSAGGEIARYDAGAKEPQFMPNAVNEDSVLLESPGTTKPFALRKDSPIGKSVEAFFEYVLDNIAVSPENRYLVGCWLLGVFFIGIFKVRPIIRFLARTGTGKTVATRLLTLFLYGEDLLQSAASTPAATYAMASKYPMLPFDNMETRNMTPAMEDFFLIASTGGSKQKRKLSTDDGVIYERANCAVVTNGIEPFNKREIIDRNMELGLDTVKYGKKHYHETKVVQGVIASRDMIASGLLKLMSRDVLPRIGAGEIERISKEFRPHSKHRFNDYLALMSIILDAIWKYKPLKGYKRPHDLVNYWLASQTESEHEQDAGTNDVLHYLNTFVERRGSLLDAKADVKEDKETGCVTIRTTTTTLLSDFRLLSRHLGMRCPWINERQLGTRIHDAESVMKKDGWSRMALTINGKRLYKYTKYTKEVTNGVSKTNRRKKRKTKVRVVDKSRVHKVQKLDVPSRKKSTKGSKVRGVQKRSNSSRKKVKRRS